MKPLEALDADQLEALARRAAALPDPPATVVQAAIALWPQAREGRIVTGVAALGQWIVGALSFDSWAGSPALAGVRSSFSATRHLLFTVDERDVDLRITPVGDAFALAGQVLGPGEGGRVELTSVQEGRELPAGVAEIDDLGEFRIEGVARGTYRLRLAYGDGGVELPPIAVGDR